VAPPAVPSAENVYRPPRMATALPVADALLKSEYVLSSALRVMSVSFLLENVLIDAARHRGTLSAVFQMRRPTVSPNNTGCAAMGIGIRAVRI
jgi:hypothetical protein